MKNYSIGLFLRQKRIAAGLTQGQLSDELGLSSCQFISNCERGICDLPVKSMKALRDLLGINNRDIFAAYMKAYAENLTNELGTKKPDLG